jgi:hypothetical protein
VSKVGWIVLVFGVILGVFAFSMDTTVTTDSQSIAGVSIPSQRVNNIGLMDERRNYLMVAGLMVVVGVGLIVADELQKSATAPSTSQAGSTTKCPYCAEVIKSEAIVCRYCGRELPTEVAEPPQALNAMYKEAEGKYAEWLTATTSDDAFYHADEAASLLAEFLQSFERVVAACDGERQAARSAIARHAVRDFPKLVENAGFSSMLQRFSDDIPGASA